MKYDLCVIGAGWAGFNAALAAARLGKSVCLIEEREVGGTCLNRGCIPAKVFVTESKHGRNISEIQKRKKEVVSRLSQGLHYLIKTRKIDLVQAHAVLQGPGRVLAEGKGEIESHFVLLATGSTPKEIPQFPFDHQKIVSSDDVLNWDVLPKSMAIVGGGFIGCEFASTFRRLGTDVTLIELQDRLLPAMDAELGKKLLPVFQKQGIKVMLKTSLENISLNDYEKILIAVGRGCCFADAGSPASSLKIENKYISADLKLATGVKGVFAAGDVLGGYMLAHVASYEGELAVRNMFGKSENRDYKTIPSSIFTVPEAASVGLSEEEARAFGVDYEVKTIHYLSVGMAHVLGDTQGFVKVVVDKKKHLISGVTLMGLEASELVNIFSVLIKNKIRISDLQKTVFAHPSISEIIGEIVKEF